MLSYSSLIYPFLIFFLILEETKSACTSCYVFFFLFVCFLYAFLCVCFYINSFIEFCGLGVFSLCFHLLEKSPKVGILEISLCGIPHLVFTRGRASIVLANLGSKILFFTYVTARSQDLFSPFSYIKKTPCILNYMKYKMRTTSKLK